ncbi:Intradiol ring-cleavage dioxygenase [Ganoderma leucocontextum]|nr:Intradiol ring-cleavage dioxygenase [Ganoderma leucocontextum]
MALTQRTTLASDWAPHVSVSFFTRLLSYLRSTWVMLVYDNPIAWRLGLRGRPNDFEDMEGPFFLVGAPSRRQVADGQAVLASPELLSRKPTPASNDTLTRSCPRIEYEPFLLALTVKDTRGDPVPHATVDAWQANSAGSYYFTSWTLRGKATADAQGRLELLTVRPGDYAGRSAHVHMRIGGPAAIPKGRHAPLTTQAYVLRGNDPSHLGRDVGMFFRSRRPDGLVVTCYATAEGEEGRSYRELQKLPVEEPDLRDAVSRWNAKLRGHGVSKPILSVGRHEIKLTAL